MARRWRKALVRLIRVEALKGLVPLRRAFRGLEPFSLRIWWQWRFSLMRGFNWDWKDRRLVDADGIADVSLTHPQKKYSRWTAAARNFPLPRTILILPIKEWDHTLKCSVFDFDYCDTKDYCCSQKMNYGVIKDTFYLGNLHRKRNFDFRNYRSPTNLIIGERNFASYDTA